jgi:hypothetical protein
MLAVMQEEAGARHHDRKSECQHPLDYRQVIDALVRQPRAFADYRCRAERFPTVRLRVSPPLAVSVPADCVKLSVVVQRLARVNDPRESTRAADVADRELRDCVPLIVMGPETETLSIPLSGQRSGGRNCHGCL